MCILFGMLKIIHQPTSPLCVEMLNDHTCRVERNVVSLARVPQLARKKDWSTKRRIVYKLGSGINSHSFHKLSLTFLSVGFYDYCIDHRNTLIPVRFDLPYGFVYQEGGSCITNQSGDTIIVQDECYSRHDFSRIPIVEISEPLTVQSTSRQKPAILVYDLAVSQDVFLDSLYDVYMKTECVTYVLFR